MKIAINTCYGGFSISKEAYEFLDLEWDGYGYAFNDATKRKVSDYNTWYLDEYDDTANNGMTVTEFNDIQQHINRIANSFHWLDLS